MSELELRKQRLDVWYHTILACIGIIITIAIVVTSVQIYAINSKINNEVKEIQSSQAKNHNTDTLQNSVIIGYLECTQPLSPDERTPAVLQNCLTQAEKADTTIIPTGEK
jgi:hypothetical protein